MSIRLSPKHGVNPAIPKCFFCLKDKNEIVLPGLIRAKPKRRRDALGGGQETPVDNDLEAPKGAVWDRRPCDECSEFMKQGVIVISVFDNQESDNPSRSGGWAVLTDAAITRMVTAPALRDQILKRRVAFLPDLVWDAIGIPRGDWPPKAVEHQHGH